jgi:hypothetical protein
VHPRTAIRAALISAISTLGVFGGRVSGTRVDPPSTGDLPRVTILTVDETSEADTTAKRAREPRFQVTAMALAGDDPDRVLDDLAEAIEAAVAGDDALRALTHRVVLTETRFDFRTQTDDGTPLSRPVARLGLVYRVTYRTTAAGIAA